MPHSWIDSRDTEPVQNEPQQCNKEEDAEYSNEDHTGKIQPQLGMRFSTQLSSPPCSPARAQ